MEEDTSRKEAIFNQRKRYSIRRRRKENNDNIHKNKIGFKKHKNYFQKISNKNINRQKRNGEL